MPDLRQSVPVALRQTVVDFLGEHVERSRAAALDFSRGRQFDVEIKDDESPVTQADLALEKLWREAVTARFPEHGIIGEEGDDHNPFAEFQWTIDPIDGTDNFAVGIPTYGTMVGLRYCGLPLAGLIDHPEMGRCSVAAFGLGTFSNAQRQQLPDGSKSVLGKREIVATSTRGTFDRGGDGHVLDHFMKHWPNTRIYYDCYAHTLALTGCIGAAIEFNLRVWDITPTEILITEAGGAFELLQEKSHPGGTLYSAVFGKPLIVREAAKILREALP